MLYSFSMSLLLTLVIELLLALLFGVRGWRNLTVAVCANVITNPAVVFLYACVRMVSSSFAVHLIGVALLEVVAVLIEGIIYKNCLDYQKISPWLLSLILNAVSFGVGFIITKGDLL